MPTKTGGTVKKKRAARKSRRLNRTDAQKAKLKSKIEAAKQKNAKKTATRKARTAAKEKTARVKKIKSTRTGRLGYKAGELSVKAKNTAKTVGKVVRRAPKAGPLGALLTGVGIGGEIERRTGIGKKIGAGAAGSNTKEMNQRLRGIKSQYEGKRYGVTKPKKKKESKPSPTTNRTSSSSKKGSFGEGLSIEKMKEAGKRGMARKERESTASKSPKSSSTPAKKPTTTKKKALKDTKSPAAMRKRKTGSYRRG